MAHRRRITAEQLRSGDDLTRAMAGIGMRFASAPLKDPNIEDTLVAASIEGMERGDLRILSVLATWIGVHRRWINADRLTRATADLTMPRTRAFWSAVATWSAPDRRFARMAHLHSGSPVDLLEVGTAFQIRRRGEDPRFEGSCLRVPAGVLRDRIDDVDRPRELARSHGTYRRRVLIGPSYRADMWAALTRNPLLSAADLAREAYGSFATAWQVKSDFAILEKGED
jgi:hypothetical protein